MTQAERGPDSCAGKVRADWNYCYDSSYTYTDICIDGITFEDPNTNFPLYIKENGFSSPYGEVFGKQIGPVSCTTKKDKVKFENFLCEEKTGQIYYNPSHKLWDVPSYWPTTEEFQQLLQKKFRELFPAPTDEVKVKNAADIVYNQHVNFRQEYTSAMNNIANGKMPYSCPTRQYEEIETDKTYDCFPKGMSPNLVFRYNNGFADEYEPYFNSLSKNVKDQNAFGFVITGEVGQSSFPKYLKPGEDAAIPLQKKCYEATITFDSSSDFNLEESLPSVLGIGPLPDDCKKTLRCSVHWCGDDPSFTLEAQSNSPFRLKVESHQKGVGGTIVPFTFKESNPYSANIDDPFYCLQKNLNADTGVPGCKKSILFTAPELDSPKSFHTNRMAIVLAQNSDTTVEETCFKFPFEWNFQTWQTKRDSGGDYDVSKFFQPSFKPPIDITEQSDVSILDIAHNVGGGLAVYKHSQPQTLLGRQKYIIQACNPQVNYHTGIKGENYFMELRKQDANPKAAAISDSGTVAVINDGSNDFLIYVFDLVKADWVRSAVITRSTGATCRIALSTHGHFFAILTSDKVYLYQKAPTGPNYQARRFEGEDSLSVPSHFNQVSIYASESGVVSVQVRDSSVIEDESSDIRSTRKTTEVSFSLLFFIRCFYALSKIFNYFSAVFHML